MDGAKTESRPVRQNFPTNKKCRYDTEDNKNVWKKTLYLYDYLFNPIFCTNEKRSFVGGVFVVGSMLGG